MASSCRLVIITFPPRNYIISCDKPISCSFSSNSFRRKSKPFNRKISCCRKDSNSDEPDDDDGKDRHKVSTWVNEVIETTETVTEVVEDLAEGVKSLAEELERRLPAKDTDGKVKEALDLVEKLAEETIKTADLAQELIDKVEEAEELLEDALAIAEARDRKEKDASRDKR